MNPSLVWRMGTSRSATAAYSSISFATVAPVHALPDSKGRRP
jgi:hypothetical protein